MVRAGCNGKRLMRSNKLLVSLGAKQSRLSRRAFRAANDNPSREQALFEKCVRRELTGIKYE